MGNEIKFKPATFYLGIVDHLAKVVEGLKPEDMDAVRGGSGQDAKRGHGVMLDATLPGVAQQGTKQAPTAEEGFIGLASMKGPSGKEKDKDQGPATILDDSHHKATDLPLPAVAAIDISTPSTHKPDSHTSPPDNNHENHGTRIPSPFPHRKPYNNE